MEEDSHVGMCNQFLVSKHCIQREKRPMPNSFTFRDLETFLSWLRFGNAKPQYKNCQTVKNHNKFNTSGSNLRKMHQKTVTHSTMTVLLHTNPPNCVTTFHCRLRRLYISKLRLIAKPCGSVSWKITHSLSHRQLALFQLY